jgi:hypothetical protein
MNNEALNTSKEILGLLNDEFAKSILQNVRIIDSIEEVLQ